jgi:hypothetical protein
MTTADAQKIHDESAGELIPNDSEVRRRGGRRPRIRGAAKRIPGQARKVRRSGDELD